MWARRLCRTRFWLTQKQQRKWAIWYYFEDVTGKLCLLSNVFLIHLLLSLLGHKINKEKPTTFFLQIHICLNANFSGKSWTLILESPLSYEYQQVFPWECVLTWRYQCIGATDLITWNLRLPEQVFKYKEEIKVHSMMYLCFSAMQWA